MKTVKDKQVLVAADFAGFELKEHLKSGGIPPFFRVRP